MSRIISVERQGIPCAPGIEAEILAVLVEDGTGKLRAYIGLVPVKRNHSAGDVDESAAWVAARGRKMDYQEAVPRYFVGIREGDFSA